MVVLPVGRLYPASFHFQKDHPIENAHAVVSAGRKAMGAVVRVVFDAPAPPSISTDVDGPSPGSLLLAFLSPSDYAHRGRRAVKPTNIEERNATYACTALALLTPPALLRLLLLVHFCTSWQHPAVFVSTFSLLSELLEVLLQTTML